MEYGRLARKLESMSRLGDALGYLASRGAFAARSKAPLVAWITLGSEEHDSSWPSTELAAFGTTTYDTGRSPSFVVVDGGTISVDRTEVVHYVLVVDSVEMHAIPHLDELRKEPSLDVSAEVSSPAKLAVEHLSDRFPITLKLAMKPGLLNRREASKTKDQHA